MGVLTTLLLGKRQTKVNRIFQRNPGGKLVNVKFLSFSLDATVNEQFTKEVEPTLNPVEHGVDITDHAIIRPEKLMIEGTISATPLSPTSQIQGLATSVAAAAGTALAGPLAGAAGAIGGGLGGKTLAGLLGVSKDRSLTDYINEMKNLIEARLPIEIVTGLTVYQDMILVSFSYTRNPTTAGSLQVQMNFQQIRFANSIFVKVKLPKVAGAGGTQNKQEQATSAPTDAVQKKSSLGLQLLQKAGVLGK
jgi:hypothetical protein